MSLPTPFYEDEKAESGYCHCGCGQECAPGRRYVSGHNLRLLTHTELQNQRIGESQKRAWATKRKRMPLGSRRYDSRGYVLVKITEGQGQWVKEHRLIMEEIVERPLLPHEHVHHINGIPGDNRPENLYLCKSGGHHKSVENSFFGLIAELLEAGVVVFDREAGRYVRR